MEPTTSNYKTYLDNAICQAPFANFCRIKKDVSPEKKTRLQKNWWKNKSTPIFVLHSTSSKTSLKTAKQKTTSETCLKRRIQPQKNNLWKHRKQWRESKKEMGTK